MDVCSCRLSLFPLRERTLRSSIRGSHFVFADVSSAPSVYYTVEHQLFAFHSTPYSHLFNFVQFCHAVFSRNADAV